MTSALCPHCGQPLPRDRGAAELTTAQLEALSAWWHMGTTKAAANLLSRSERTVINQLYGARIRNGVHTSAELVTLYFNQLRSKSELLMKHNKRGKEAA